MNNMKNSFDTECSPAELAAAADLIGFWDSKTSPAVWITVCLLVVIGINILGVGKHSLCNCSPLLTVIIGAYGEAEFWFR